MQNIDLLSEKNCLHVNIRRLVDDADEHGRFIHEVAYARLLGTANSVEYNSTEQLL